MTHYNILRVLFSDTINGAYTSLDKSRTWVRDVLEIKNFTICRIDYFLRSTLTNTLFQFPDYVKHLSEIRRTCTLKQSVRQILKTNNVTCFSFRVLCPSSHDSKSYYSF